MSREYKLYKLFYLYSAICKSCLKPQALPVVSDKCADWVG